MHQYIEGLRYARPGDTIAFHDGFISFRTADDIIRLEGKQFLENIGSAVGFEGPHFHFTESLTTELCLTTQRLLCNETVRPDTAGVHFIIHHMVQFFDGYNDHRSFLVETITGFTIIQVCMTELR